MPDQVEKFIERFGVFWEEDGLPRIAGRIYALTLISDEPLSLDEIASRLGVSKASVSNDTRLLERMGFIERLSLPGDRRDYYQSTERSFERAIGERIRRMSRIEELLESGQSLVADSPAVRARIDDHHFAFRHVRKALETALDALTEKHDRAATSSTLQKKTRKP